MKKAKTKYTAEERIDRRRESLRKSRRRYDAANPEKRRERRNRSARNRREVELARVRKWRAANPDKCKAYVTADYRRHKAKRQAANRNCKAVRRSKEIAARETFASREEAQMAITARSLENALPRKVSRQDRFHIQIKA